MPAPIASFAKVTVVSRYQQQIVENTLTYKSQTPAGFTDVAAFDAAAWTYWNATVMTTLLGDMNQQYEFIGLWTQIYTPTTIYVKQEHRISSFGINANAGIPSNCALVTKKLSDYGGKKNRGRNFWTGVDDSWIDPITGLWIDANVAPWVATVTAAYLHQITTVTPARIWDPVITDAEFQRSTLIVAGGYNVAPRVQRRREIGRGI